MARDGMVLLTGASGFVGSAVARRLRAAGAVILGKATMSEFAFWPQSHNSWTLRVGSPYDTSKDAGGSSSGSAAATAANLTLAAMQKVAALDEVTGIFPNPGPYTKSYPNRWTPLSQKIAQGTAKASATKSAAKK